MFILEEVVLQQSFACVKFFCEAIVFKLWPQNLNEMYVFKMEEKSNVFWKYLENLNNGVFTSQNLTRLFRLPTTIDLYIYIYIQSASKIPGHRRN